MNQLLKNKSLHCVIEMVNANAKQFFRVDKKIQFTPAGIEQGRINKEDPNVTPAGIDQGRIDKEDSIVTL